LVGDSDFEAGKRNLGGMIAGDLIMLPSTAQGKPSLRAMEIKVQELKLKS
jgi:hypothetical protein